MKIRTISIKKAVYVIYMMFVLNVTYSVFNTAYAYNFAILFALFGVALYAIPMLVRGKIERKLVRGIVAFLLPMILITGISIITAICVHGSSIYGSDVSQSLLRCIHYCAAFLIAYYSVRWFGKDTVRLIVISGLISYATVFVQYIQRAGLKGLIFFQHVVNGVGLEVHDLTYCMGLFFIYYLLSDEYSKSYKIKALIPISIAIIYGNKRSLFLGLAISILIYVLLNRFESQSLQLLWIVFGIYIVGAFIFLWLVKSGVFATILTYFNIPDMARLRIWNYFSDSYTLTPGYWGRGIAYTDNRMVLRETMQSLDITNKIPIHNDILRIYIGWGFIPFLYYLVNFFLLQIRWFRKQGDNNNGWQYFAIASCVYFINFFDNMITSVSFNICFFVIWLLLTKEKGNIDIGQGREIYGQ
ncbi:hypothetical protein DXA57_16260 [Blautia sp. OF03-15BH]|uniref:O-antigen ligase family protein n=1 Tax=Blautia sp. OF03-15BH TaxID=2292287 RepID=UPI000E5330ED|nr:O-antigen ligase family protein [Blautia sp. OF03-15BH]RGX96943.1 hypothetical protein DXA57_16260 [Blautia sp. OF03-15BH]